MAATGTPTPNIGLRIPLGTDPASVDDINYNSNLIDTKLGAVGNDSVQDQLNDLNSKITNITITQTNAATGRTLGKNNVRKWGRNVEVVVSCDTITPASNGWINIATLPVGDAYRPYETLDFGITNNADDTMVHGRIENGVIKVYGKTGVSLAPIVLVHFISAE